MQLDIDVSELLKWARYFENVPRRTKAAVARALNTVGDNVEREAVANLADRSGLDEDAIRNLMVVHRASPNDLTWEIDLSAAAGQSPEWSRPWERRSDDVGDENTLVKIVTQEDETVCPICEAAAEHSPYSLAEANQKLPLHPHCRCFMLPWVATRRLPVAVSSGSSHSGSLHKMTMRQIGRVVADELRMVLTATDE